MAVQCSQKGVFFLSLLKVIILLAQLEAFFVFLEPKARSLI